MLSYAFVINGWIETLDKYEKNNNQTGLFYYYGLIIRNIFFYEIPEEGALKEKSPEPSLSSKLWAVTTDLYSTVSSELTSAFSKV